MLHPTLRGCIGKIADAVDLQSTAFHFHEYFVLPFFQIEINAGISIGIHRSDHIIVLRLQPFLHDLIRCLTVNVDPADPVFINSHQVIQCLSCRIIRLFQTHRCPGEQKFPASSGIFHMHRLRFPCNLHMGNKPVGTVNEFSLYDLSILHVKFPILNSIRSPTFDTALRPQLPRLCGISRGLPRPSATCSFYPHSPFRIDFTSSGTSNNSITIHPTILAQARLANSICNRRIITICRCDRLQ